MTQFYVKVFQVEDQVLVAACDAELLGKTIRAKSGFELHISERFYGGSLMTAEQVCEVVKDATSLNLLGDRIVQLVLSTGIGHSESVMKVGDVAHLILIHV